jgi:DNA-binding MarR family transcriptional regulator
MSASSSNGLSREPESVRQSAHPVSRNAKIRALLYGRPLTSGEIARFVGISRAKASASLANLSYMGLVQQADGGHSRLHTLTPLGREKAAVEKSQSGQAGMKSEAKL